MFTVFKDNFQRHALLRAITFILLGIAIVINPSLFFQFVAYIVAGYFIIMGISNIYADYRSRKQSGSFGIGLVSGVLFFILAFAVLFFASTIVSILPFLLGLTVLANGLFQLVVSLNNRKVGWIIYSVIILIAGLTLTFNPFGSLLVLFQVFGFLLIFMGISEVVSHFQNHS